MTSFHLQAPVTCFGIALRLLVLVSLILLTLTLPAMLAHAQTEEPQTEEPESGSDVSADDEVADTGANESEADDNDPQDSGDQQPAEPSPLTPAQQAEEHYAEGVDAMRAEDYVEATKQLRAAAKLVPDRAEYHYMLGSLALKKQEGIKAWQLFRKAMRLDPNHRKSDLAFAHIWSMFNKMGVLDVGTSRRKVRSTLGTPDRETTRGRQQRAYFGFMVISFVDGRLFSVINTRDLSPSALRAVDTLNLEIDTEKWKVASRQINSRVALVFYVPVRETMRNWTERIATRRMLGLAKRNISLSEIADRLRAQVLKECPSAEWTLIDQSDDDLVYEWRNMGSRETQSRHELCRVVFGKNDIHRITYAKKVPELMFEQRAIWLSTLRAAKLVGLKKAEKP